MKGILRSVFTLSACALVCWSCEKEQSGTVDLFPLPPFLSSASLSVGSVNLDTDTSGAVTPLGNLTYRINLGVAGKGARQGADAPTACVLEVSTPTQTAPSTVLSLPLQATGPDTVAFSSNVSFTLQRSDVGLVRLAFRLETGSGQESNTVQRSLLVTRRNSRPQIDTVYMPDSATIGQLPSPDSTLLIAAAAADSDGLTDIADVRFVSIKPDGTPANNGFPISLYDDGSSVTLVPPDITSGDAVAGDGIFSRKVVLLSFTFSLTPPYDTVYTQRGVYQFRFTAIDHSGAVSDTVTRAIKIK